MTSQNDGQVRTSELSKTRRIWNSHWIIVLSQIHSCNNQLQQRQVDKNIFWIKNCGQYLAQTVNDITVKRLIHESLSYQQSSNRHYALVKIYRWLIWIKKSYFVNSHMVLNFKDTAGCNNIFLINTQFYYESTTLFKYTTYFRYILDPKTRKNISMYISGTADCNAISNMYYPFTSWQCLHAGTNHWNYLHIYTDMS